MFPDQLSEEIVAQVHKEINENVKNNKNDLEHIKKWLKQQPHLPDTWDDVRLMNFLRGCKFSLETCKRKLDMYFTMRTIVPEFFTNRDVHRPEIQEALKLAQIPVIPGLTKDGRRVYVVRGTDKSRPPVFHDVMKIFSMIADIRLAEEPFGLSNDTCILDAGLVNHTYMQKFTPTAIKKYVTCIQEGFPIRINEAHIINVSPTAYTIMAIVKPLLKKKLQDRIIVHSKLETLYKHIPKEMVPQEYGGSGESMVEINDRWKEKMASYTDWYKAQENVRSDETRRPGISKSYNELFGIEGSFRKLEID